MVDPAERIYLGSGSFERRRRGKQCGEGKTGVRHVGICYRAAGEVLGLYLVPQVHVCRGMKEIVLRVAL